MPADALPVTCPVRAAHYKERGFAPQPTGLTAKTPLSGTQPFC
jgi:hypothetical protein